MKLGLILFVVVAGILDTIQSGSNATLDKTLDRPVWVLVCVFCVALSTALVVALVSGQRLPCRNDLATVPWWAWFGGVLGAVYILAMVLVADKLGAAVFVGLTATMAVLTSLVMGHDGLVGFARRPAGRGRLGDGLLMAAGLSLVAKF